ncbi:hypothetical protein [Mycoplasmopsis synoviae]|uniref:hypothetical protein n=1 Tax=Mycoplasmopsis synoviae TaxID=2109 RepID=UPI001CE13CEC|nr:hypothetical protein [Mycoplasmopsis synoviae]UBX97449.1 hypothetical protein K6989_00145 [Mycoplasmopsis synoviae]UBX98134.1 hypothetical protein K6987_00280 [Mycoplasmopsis synoviae]UBX99166.1 hypothetical protein K6988_02415 [Mycoplasmopsis synoviae]UBY00107.1 hypothetical protein K6990_00430 [Mycoplasmopsis synoviae]
MNKNNERENNLNSASQKTSQNFSNEFDTKTQLIDLEKIETVPLKSKKEIVKLIIEKNQFTEEDKLAFKKQKRIYWMAITSISAIALLALFLLLSVWFQFF